MSTSNTIYNSLHLATTHSILGCLFHHKVSPSMFVTPHTVTKCVCITYNILFSASWHHTLYQSVSASPQNVTLCVCITFKILLSVCWHHTLCPSVSVSPQNVTKCVCITTKCHQVCLYHRTVSSSVSALPHSVCITTLHTTDSGSHDILQDEARTIKPSSGPSPHNIVTRHGWGGNKCKAIHSIKMPQSGICPAPCVLRQCTSPLSRGCRGKSSAKKIAGNNF